MSDIFRHDWTDECGDSGWLTVNTEDPEGAEIILSILDGIGGSRHSISPSTARQLSKALLESADKMESL